MLDPDRTPRALDAPNRTARRGPWRTLWRALLWILLAEGASLAVVVLMYVFLALQHRFAGPGGVRWATPDLMTTSIAATLIVQGYLAYAAIRCGRRSGFGDLDAGLANFPVRRPRLLAFLAALQIGWFGVFIALSTWLTWLAQKAGETAPPFITGLSTSGAPLRLAASALAMVVAPIAEELFFRGWMWTELRRFWGLGATMAATGGLWLLLHAPEGLFKPILLLPTALLFSFARHYSGSVRGSILLHLINNGLAFGLLLAATARPG